VGGGIIGSLSCNHAGVSVGVLLGTGALDLDTYDTEGSWTHSSSKADARVKQLTANGLSSKAVALAIDIYYIFCVYVIIIRDVTLPFRVTRGMICAYVLGV
jgi:hypothetical protein